MSYFNAYKVLFDLRFLHHYFLDEGNNVYTPTGSTGQQPRFDNNRQGYNVSNFFRIVPTQRTEKLLANYRGIFRQYKDGIKVAIQANGDESVIGFNSNLYFDFTIEITDPFFENYTDIVWTKSDLIFLSNVTPTAYTPASELEPEAVPVVASLLSTYQTETPGTGININLLKDVSKSELTSKFGFIRIYMTGEAGEISLVQSGNPEKFATDTPVLDIYLTNRKTIWRYIEEKGATPVFETETAEPLTQNGYVKIVPPGSTNPKYPNPDAKIIVKEGSDYYSEVFIK